ncbi:MAG: PTS sugar transporter subunit IIA [Candidatus Omnitrophota bacterium]|nr:MAG: PTS sugar transporter subunit IIA [Candidatus Omnitrophota bacterium]
MDINVLDYLDKDSILLGVKQKNKKQILSHLLDHFIKKKKIKKTDKNEILKALLQREEMGSTAIGGRIALPHARIDSAKKVVLGLLVSKEGVNFESLDQEPVNIVALLLSSQKEAGLHLKMLAFLARMLRDKYFVQQLKNSKDEEQILALVKRHQKVMR